MFHPQTPQSPSNYSPSFTDASNPASSMTSLGTTLPTPAHSVSAMAADPAHDTARPSPYKRKRAGEDVGDPRQKRARVEESDRWAFVRDLHYDVGEKYLVGTAEADRSLPDVRKDVLQTYGLAGIAARFARVLPNGAKNALRKTYKGQIKSSGMAGHFEPTQAHENEQDRMIFRAYCPAEDWHNLHVAGRELDRGFSADVEAALPKALDMACGPVPSDAWDSSCLGDVTAATLGALARPPIATRARTPALSVAARSRPSPQSSKPSPPQSGPPPPRPQRSLKRSYGESSYEGYGEGFPDDEQAPDRPSDDRGSVKRKKMSKRSASGSVYQQDYGPGMIGV